MTEFTADWVGNKVAIWQDVLAPWFLDNVLTGEGSTLDCVDSWAGDTIELGNKAVDGERLFDANTAIYGDRVRKHKQYSFDWLLKRNQHHSSDHFDFIYVDGGHDAANALQDLALSWRLLRPGGVFICDDYQWEHPHLARLPRVAIDAFFSCRGDWDLLRNDSQFVAQKCASGIEAIVVCVDYADYLAETLPYLAARVDRVAVVTTKSDKQTQVVANRHANVRCATTDVFYWHGASFNKGAGINVGLAHLERTGWVLHVDADIALLDPLPIDLDRECLWTATRKRLVGMEEWNEVRQGTRDNLADMRNVFLHGSLVPSGYLQLWHWPTCRPWYCVWDDDDVYLPWHMGAAASAIADADYTIPTLIYKDKRNRLERKANQYLFHGAWAFRRTAFDQVGGYPFMQSGQDQGLLRRFKSAKLSRSDPIRRDPRPSYIYRWYTAHSKHISAMGADGYERLANDAVDPIANLNPHWDRDWTRLSEDELTVAARPA